MKVLVKGAAGKTGKAVVQQALAAGHEVTACVQKADEYREISVRVIEGDATSAAAIEEAVLGQDAAVDTMAAKLPIKRLH